MDLDAFMTPPVLAGRASDLILDFLKGRMSVDKGMPYQQLLRVYIVLRSEAPQNGLILENISRPCAEGPEEALECVVSGYFESA